MCQPILFAGVSLSSGPNELNRGAAPNQAKTGDSGPIQLTGA